MKRETLFMVGRGVVGLVVTLLLQGCTPKPQNIDWSPLPEPAADEVESVMFLVGDAGTALPGHSPVLARMQREVESWSGRVAREGAVSVLYLGDIVYPVGVHARGTEEFPRDSMYVQAQVDVVGGPNARRYRSTGYFMAGNHDWGMTVGPEGLAQLQNLVELIDAFREEEGYPVAWLPEAGHPGPGVVDIGDRIRLVVLDTHWWLQPRYHEIEGDSVLLVIGEAVEEAGGRDVVFAAHHPWLSGGSHGGPMPIWEGFGILYLLRRSGSLVQDINSVPYRKLLLGLQAIFAETGSPLIWAGGHDHSLQVLDPPIESGPEWALVSGSGSKLTDVAHVPGLIYGDDSPGFMRLTWLRDGSVHLHVYAAGAEYQHCAVANEERRLACMSEAVEAYNVEFAIELK